MYERRYPASFHIILLSVLSPACRDDDRGDDRGDRRGGGGGGGGGRGGGGETRGKKQSLLVRNLDRGTSIDTLRDVFGKYGEVKDVS